MNLDVVLAEPPVVEPAVALNWPTTVTFEALAGTGNLIRSEAVRIHR